MPAPAYISPPPGALIAGGALSPGVIAPPHLYNPAPIWGQIAAKEPGATPTPPSAPVTDRNPIPDIRDETVRFWMGQGMPRHIAEGIADRVSVESGFRPSAVGDSGTSGGLYQEHADRLARLKSFAAAMGKPWTDPDVQNRFAAFEAHGGDQIAAKHWQEIASAPDRATAERLFTKYFERPAAPGDLAGEIQSGYSKVANDYREEQAAALKAIQSLDKDSPDVEARVREATARADKASDALLRLTAEKPNPPVRQALGHFGSLATIIGMLGGMLTRQPAMGALNGAASAMEAANAGDWRRYRDAVDTWKTQSDMLLHISQMQQERLRDILSERHQSMNEKLAKLKFFLNANGMTAQADLLETKGLEAVAKTNIEALKANNEARALQKKLNMDAERVPLIRAQTQQAEAKAEQTAQQNEMMKPPSASVTMPDKWQGKPDTPPPGLDIDPGVWASAIAYVKSGGTIHPPFSLWGNNPLALAFNHAIPFAEKALGIKPSDLPTAGATYQGERSAQRALGTRLSALSVGINEASAAAPAVIQTSRSVPRTDFSPIFNAVINNAAYHTGDPNIVAFKAALQTFLNRYASAINPQGHMTDQQQRHAYDVLNTAMTHGQLEAGVHQLLLELSYMKSGLQEAIGTVGGAYAGGIQPEIPGTQPKTEFHVGQIIEHGGKKYRVTGGDLSGDPDVEPVQ